MADPVLITSSTRPFNWTMTDLTLFGGQPTPGMLIGRAPDDATTISAPQTIASVPLAVPEGEIAARETTALLDNGALQPAVPAAVQAPPSAVVAPPSFEPAATQGSIGSSGVATVSTPLHAVTDEGVIKTEQPGGVAAADPGTDGATSVPTDALVNAVAPLSVAHAAELPQPVESLVGAVETIATPSGHFSATVTTLLGEIDELGETTTEAIATGSFAGADPAAGLTTLVGMMESAEVFDLDEAVATSTTVASPGSIIDALAADAMPSPLLGENIEDADHLLDDHGIQVGL